MLRRCKMGQVKNYFIWHHNTYGYEPENFEHFDEYIADQDGHISDATIKSNDLVENKNLSDAHKHQFRKNKTKSDPQKSWLLSITVLIITVAGLIISGLAIYLPNRQQPKFIIKNSILNSNAKLIILACNKKANQSSNLNVIFDGYSFPLSAILAKSNSQEMYEWNFEITKYTNEKKLTKDGEHKIKVSLPGSSYSEEYKILFISVPPIVKIQKTNVTGQTIVKGKITTEQQIPKKYLSVYITYFQDDKEYNIDIPLTTKVHKKTGITYFEFVTSLQGLPVLSPNDPNYSAPFWSINVIDQAGNEYYYEQSYAKFMAPGNENFGVGDIANVKIEKIPEDVNRHIKSIVRIIPLQKIINRLPNGKTPIDLKVRSIGNAAKLEWKYNITSIIPLTLVYRDDKKIGASVTSEYIDYSMNQNATYRVEQKTEEMIYRSNESNFLSNKIHVEHTRLKPDSSNNNKEANSNSTKIPRALLTIRSNVFNDTVYIDDKKYGSTRIDIELPPGIHTIKVEKFGYIPFEKIINLYSDKTIKAELIRLDDYMILVSYLDFEKTLSALSSYIETFSFKNFLHVSTNIKNTIEKSKIKHKKENSIAISDEDSQKVKKYIFTKFLFYNNESNLKYRSLRCGVKISRDLLRGIAIDKKVKFKWNDRSKCDYTTVLIDNNWKRFHKQDSYYVWIPLNYFLLDLFDIFHNYD